MTTPHCEKSEYDASYHIHYVEDLVTGFRVKEWTPPPELVPFLDDPALFIPDPEHFLAISPYEDTKTPFGYIRSRQGAL